MTPRRGPHFVKATLLKDGGVELIDNDGETFRVEMRSEMAYPLVSRMLRAFEMRAGYEKMWRERESGAKPPQRFELTVAKGERAGE